MRFALHTGREANAIVARRACHVQAQTGTWQHECNAVTGFAAAALAHQLRRFGCHTRTTLVALAAVSALVRAQLCK
jgi:hypothetical protein